MQIVVTGRRTTVDEQLRAYLSDRLSRLDKLDPKVDRVDVEVCEEANPRLADQRVRVELTWHGRGPVVRGEAAGGEPQEAIDLALAKLDRRLRKAADRRRIHRGLRTPVSLAAATAGGVGEVRRDGAPADTGDGVDADAAAADGVVDSVETLDSSVEAAGPMVVREKDHVAAPMTLDQALFEMELVGHEFYLFVDSDKGLPSVVYRRRGYDYGVLRLHSPAAPEISGDRQG